MSNIINFDQTPKRRHDDAQGRLMRAVSVLHKEADGQIDHARHDTLEAAMQEARAALDVIRETLPYEAWR